MSEKNKEDWKNVGNGTIMKSMSNDKIIVIAPTDLKKIVVPLFCPLCTYPMKTKEDSASYRNIGCCEICEMRFGTAIKVEKKTFLEITREHQAWSEYLKDRLNRSKNLIKLK